MEPTRAPALTGDESGFRAWASVRMPRLRRKAYLLCGDWHAADDLVQETLVTVFRRWARLVAQGNVDPYADRVLFTRHVDATRRPWRRERASDAVPEHVDDGAGRALSEVEPLDASLTRALLTLPPTQRAVVVLSYLDDLSITQVAAVLDLPVGTVKSRLSRGTARLRKLLQIPSDPTPPSRSTSTGGQIIETEART